MRELTRAEEQVMQILWSIEKGFVKDLLEKMTEPKPAYNTVSTIIRILERKGFVAHKAYGKSHEYYPIISKDAYRTFTIDNLLKGYFDGSVASFLAFYAKDNSLSNSELNEIVETAKAE
ncbi:MAG: BlaI/MecI/CopY family transcriptional regulator [Nitritalea sp.]